MTTDVGGHAGDAVPEATARGTGPVVVRAADHDRTERHAALIDALDVGYCLVELVRDAGGQTVDYRFVETNGAFETQTGLASVAGRLVSEAIPGYERQQIEPYDAVARTGEPAHFTRSMVPLGGRIYDVRAYRVGGPGSLLVGILFADRSEHLAREQRQRDYIAMVSHDLGTPMTVIRAQAQLLKRRELYDARRVDLIVAQIDRMERLLSGLRNVVRAEEGWLERRTVTVDLGLLVLEAVERGRAQSPAHRIHLELDGPVVGYWDRERIEQILDNLVSNAIKYSAAGTLIRVALSSDEARVRLTVRDEGIGIPAEAQPMLFERFYRASEGGAVEGMGLGLYIVRTLVHAKGGTVSVASEPGAGSTFTVELPRRSVAPVPEDRELTDLHILSL